ncbi:hypothetical protein GBAR_LOCUS18641 [Geodia barretti]|uniref:Uncharacterized protein n=1 Tax=Geodia barretti TaxID=519541 RepID=A0AA35WUA6_GEOBA|nr:hypothetical protein GBAR_LOCUS18641 [Geodia barretti]
MSFYTLVALPLRENTTASVAVREAVRSGTVRSGCFLKTVSVVEDRSLLAPYFWSRLAMAGPVGPMWFDPAPPGYPWSMLMVPVNITTKGAELLVDQIKEAGNNSMKTGNHYDALWKYNHALVLCRDHKLSGRRVSVISSNCSQACLHLTYYLDAFSHASDAINNDPSSPILYKVWSRCLTHLCPLSDRVEPH